MSVILTKRNISRAIPALASARRTSDTLGLDTQKAEAQPPQGTGVEPKPDDSLTRIMKMIPGEATALYTAAVAIDQQSHALPIAAFVGCAVVVVLVIKRSGDQHNPPIEPEPMQYVFQLLAFTAWALAIRSPIAPYVAIPDWVVPLVVLFIPVIGGFILRDPPTDDARGTDGDGTLSKLGNH